MNTIDPIKMNSLNLMDRGTQYSEKLPRTTKDKTVSNTIWLKNIFHPTFLPLRPP